MDILSINLYLYEVHHIKRLHYIPWLPMISFIHSPYGFEHETLKRKKLKKKTYLYLAGIDMVFCTISIPRMYRYGFLEILSISLHLYLVLHTKWLFHMTWLSMISFILSSHGFQSESMKRKKLKKTISSPMRYRYGFLEICL